MIVLCIYDVGDGSGGGGDGHGIYKIANILFFLQTKMIRLQMVMMM